MKKFNTFQIIKKIKIVVIFFLDFKHVISEKSSIN